MNSPSIQDIDIVQELMIFADYYRTEICSIDVETGRCDRFGGGSYDSR